MAAGAWLAATVAAPLHVALSPAGRFLGSASPASASPFHATAGCRNSAATHAQPPASWRLPSLPCELSVRHRRCSVRHRTRPAASQGALGLRRNLGAASPRRRRRVGCGRRRSNRRSNGCASPSQLQAAALFPPRHEAAAQVPPVVHAAPWPAAAPAHRRGGGHAGIARRRCRSGGAGGRGAGGAALRERGVGSAVPAWLRSLQRAARQPATRPAATRRPSA